MTFAYFHLKPYVFAPANNGTVTAGIEVKMAMEFAKRYKLRMEWFNANYAWGAFDNKLQRWNGVVGHTLYGDVDIGMCNIDITHSRYQVIDYSTFIR